MARPRHGQIAKKHIDTRIWKLKMVVEKMRKIFVQLSYKSSNYKVPEDVKQGHFAVIAVLDGEEKRIIIPLSYLTHPTFLRMLEKAEAEYGFNHKGALTIPCRPGELETMF